MVAVVIIDEFGVIKTLYRSVSLVFHVIQAFHRILLINHMCMNIVLQEDTILIVGIIHYEQKVIEIRTHNISGDRN